MVPGLRGTVLTLGRQRPHRDKQVCRSRVGLERDLEQGQSPQLLAATLYYGLALKDLQGGDLYI